MRRLLDLERVLELGVCDVALMLDRKMTVTEARRRGASGLQSVERAHDAARNALRIRPQSTEQTKRNERHDQSTSGFIVRNPSLPPSAITNTMSDAFHASKAHV